MKRTTFNPTIWSMMSLNLESTRQLDHNGNRIKELILNSSYAEELGVSEMNLSITRLSAIDNMGNEHSIKNFEESIAVQIKQMGSGHFLKTSSVVSLDPGTYTKLRFHLAPSDNLFINKDGEEVSANKGSYLDFDIQNDFTIYDGEVTEVKLWFNLEPYNISRHFKPLKSLFNALRNPSPKLTNSMN